MGDEHQSEFNDKVEKMHEYEEQQNLKLTRDQKTLEKKCQAFYQEREQFEARIKILQEQEDQTVVTRTIHTSALGDGPVPEKETVDTGISSGMVRNNPFVTKQNSMPFPSSGPIQRSNTGGMRLGAKSQATQNKKFKKQQKIIC